MNKQNRADHLILFADKQHEISMYDIKQARFCMSIENIVQDYGLQRLIVLDQIHADTGHCVEDLDLQYQSSWFEFQGDFLITNQKDIALIVLTGDCVPLILYDPIHHVIGLVHAGWKGSYTGVVQKTLHMMQQKYNTRLNDLICTFGPSARECCYEVSQQFVDDFEKKYPMLVKFTKRNSKWYFDNSLFLQELLKKFGILEQNIHTNKVLCTICNPQFCSFRKEKEMAGRQITMVALL